MARTEERDGPVVGREHETVRGDADDAGGQLLDERPETRFLDSQRRELARLLIARARGRQPQLEPRRPVGCLRDVVVDAGPERLVRRSFVGGLHQQHDRHFEIARPHVGDGDARLVVVLDQHHVERRRTGLQIGILERVGERYALERRQLTLERGVELRHVTGIRHAKRGDAWCEGSGDGHGDRARRPLPDRLLDRDRQTREEGSALAHALVGAGLAIQLERLLGRRDDRQATSLLARVSDERECILSGNTPADDQRIVADLSGQMGARARKLHREVEFEMRMRVTECTADDARFTRVAGDVEHADAIGQASPPRRRTHRQTNRDRPTRAL